MALSTGFQENEPNHPGKLRLLRIPPTYLFLSYLVTAKTTFKSNKSYKMKAKQYNFPFTIRGKRHLLAYNRVSNGVFSFITLCLLR